MKLAKKVISTLVSAVMLVSLVPVMVSASMEIKLGDYVQVGEYYEQPILWRCVGFEKIVGTDENGNPIVDSTNSVTEYQEGYLPLMLSEKALCIKSFDVGGINTNGSHARGNNNGQNRQKSGSNYWADSNIRAWLNSTADAGNVAWNCGNAPDACGYLALGQSEKFAKEAGFLNKFTQTNLKTIQTVSQKSIIDGYEYSATKSDNALKLNTDIKECTQNYATADSETVTDNIFLLDIQQLSNVYNNNAKLGNDYHVGRLTKQAIANVDSKDKNLSVDQKYNTWIRTPYAESNSSNVYVAAHAGGVSFAEAYVQNAIRPAFYLNVTGVSVAAGTGIATNPYIVTSDDLIKVTINGDTVIFDQEPIISNDRTLVPVRAIFEKLGATVTWDDPTQTVTAVKGITKIQLQINSNVMLKNSEEITVDVPAQVINDRTYVPVRVIAEAFGCDVQWDDATQTVVIGTSVKETK